MEVQGYSILPTVASRGNYSIKAGLCLGSHAGQDRRGREKNKRVSRNKMMSEEREGEQEKDRRRAPWVLVLGRGSRQLLSSAHVHLK